MGFFQSRKPNAFGSLAVATLVTSPDPNRAGPVRCAAKMEHSSVSQLLDSFRNGSLSIDHDGGCNVTVGNICRLSVAHAVFGRGGSGPIPHIETVVEDGVTYVVEGKELLTAVFWAALGLIPLFRFEAKQVFTTCFDLHTHPHELASFIRAGNPHWSAWTRQRSVAEFLAEEKDRFLRSDTSNSFSRMYRFFSEFQSFQMSHTVSESARFSPTSKDAIPYDLLLIDTGPLVSTDVANLLACTMIPDMKTSNHLASVLQKQALRDLTPAPPLFANVLFTLFAKTTPFQAVGKLAVMIRGVLETNHMFSNASMSLELALFKALLFYGNTCVKFHDPYEQSSLLKLCFSMDQKEGHRLVHGYYEDNALDVGVMNRARSIVDVVCRCNRLFRNILGADSSAMLEWSESAEHFLAMLVLENNESFHLLDEYGEVLYALSLRSSIERRGESYASTTKDAKKVLACEKTADCWMRASNCLKDLEKKKDDPSFCVGEAYRRFLIRCTETKAKMREGFGSRKRRKPAESFDQNAKRLKMFDECTARPERTFVPFSRE